MYIHFNFNDIMKKLNKNEKYSKITKHEFESIIPKKIDRKTLNDFYLETGLNIFHYFNDLKGKILFFNRKGAFPESDLGSGDYLSASGEYFKNDGDIELRQDIAIEEKVQLITQTSDGKNYIIIPENINIPDGDIKNPNNNKMKEFHVPIEIE